MKLNKLDNYYVTLAVFLMVTVAVVAGQSRANQQHMVRAIDPLVQGVSEQISPSITLRLDGGLPLDVLKGHN